MGAKRTAFGTYGGKFVKTSATDLQTFAAKAALTAANVQPEKVDTVIIGNVLSVNIYLLALPSLFSHYSCIDVTEFVR